VHPAQLTNERDEQRQELSGKIDAAGRSAVLGLGTCGANHDLKWRMSAKAIDASCCELAGRSSRAACRIESGGPPGLCHVQPAAPRGRGAIAARRSQASAPEFKRWTRASAECEGGEARGRDEQTATLRSMAARNAIGRLFAAGLEEGNDRPGRSHPALAAGSPRQGAEGTQEPGGRAG